MRERGLIPLAVGAALVLTLTGCGSATPTGPAAASKAAASRTPVQHPAADDFKSVRTYATVAEPTKLRIPAIDLSTPPLQQLGRAADESIALPTEPQLAGWFKGGPRPGQPGPAVIIGHVDWDHSGAVFFRLREMKPGEKVFVDRSDGSTGEFVVTKVRQVAKDDFPTQDVYGPDLAPSLRLITCGGQFDYATHNYLDNVIVFATPV